MVAHARRVQAVLFGVAGLASAFLFAGTCVQSAAYCWSAVDDLSHGWLVMAVSAWAAWQARGRMVAEARSPDWRGVPLLLASLAAFWLGAYGNQIRLSQIGLVGSLIALPFACWGAGVARQMLFPALNLLLIMPMGFVESHLAPLRSVSAWLAAGLLNGIQIHAVRTGTLVSVIGRHACALDATHPKIWHIHSLFAYAALAAGYAWLSQRTALRRWLLFACVAPLAVLGEVVRICVAVALVSGGCDAERAFVYIAGYAVAAFVLLGLVLAGRWIARHTPGPVAGPVVWTAAGRALPERGAALWPALVAAGMTLSLLAFAAFAHRPAPQMEPDNYLAADLPPIADRYPGSHLLFCQNQACGRMAREDELTASQLASNVCPVCGQPLDRLSLKEKEYLRPEPRILRRSYWRDSSRPITVTVIVSQESRLSIHRPELCLPSQKSYIQSEKRRVLSLGAGRRVVAKVLTITRVDMGRQCLLYWFVNPRTETPSHLTRLLLDAWDQAVHNRVNRWAMVTVFCPGDVADGQPAAWHEMERFVAAWYPQLTRAAGFTRGTLTPLQ